MNQYYKTHRRPLHDYLFAYFHIVAKWMTSIAPLANWFMQMNWSKKIISKVFGIAEQRQLPLFAQTNKTIQTSKTSKTTQTNKTILFLSDVFSEYIEPEVKESAIAILNHLGYEVKELSNIGAGASFLSKGFIEQAKAHANQVLDEIKSLGAESTIHIVGCEPPEVYCLKHEYLALLPERKTEIQSIEKNVWLVDEFVLRVANLGIMELNQKLFSSQKKGEKIFFHPHCHQQAQGVADDGLPSGSAATIELLKLCGFDVQPSDAGCCGMAGTFGFDAEHYDLSMKIGELKLLPKIKQFAPSVLSDTSPKSDINGFENNKNYSFGFGGGRVGVVSSGAACRMQIRDGAGVEAKHPLVLIRDALYGSH